MEIPLPIPLWPQEISAELLMLMAIPGWETEFPAFFTHLAAMGYRARNAMVAISSIIRDGGEEPAVLEEFLEGISADDTEAGHKAKGIRTGVYNEVRPLILRHRANTSGAIDDAIDKKADGIEIDIQMTTDGHIVLYHEPTVMVDGKRAPTISLSLEELRRAVPGRLLTIEDILGSVQEHHWQLYIHHNDWTPWWEKSMVQAREAYHSALVNNLAGILGKSDSAQRTMFFSYDLKALSEFKSLLHDVDIPMTYRVPPLSANQEEMDEIVRGNISPDVAARIDAHVEAAKTTGAQRVLLGGPIAPELIAYIVENSGLGVDGGSSSPEQLKVLYQAGMSTILADDVDMARGVVDFKIGPRVAVGDGIGKVEMEFDSGDRAAKGRAVILDPDKVEIRQEVVPEAVEYDFGRYRVASKDKQVLEGKKEFKKFPGRTLERFVQGLDPGDNVLAVSNSLHTNFWARNAFLIIDGVVIRKPDNVVSLFEEHPTALNGKFWIFGLDKGNVGVKEVNIADGNLGPAVHAVRNGIAGLPLVMKGANISDCIEKGRPPVSGNQQSFDDPKKEAAAMSAIGKDRDGNIIILNMAGDPNVKKEMTFHELAQAMINLSAVEAVGLGVSADVNQYLRGEKNPFLSAKPRIGSLTSLDYPEGRPLGAFVMVCPKTGIATEGIAPPDMSQKIDKYCTPSDIESAA